MKNSDKFVSEEYSLDPNNTIKFDEKIINFNQVKKDEDYQSMKEQISDGGQTVPIYMRKGLCGDGRHRIKACRELGIQVKAIDVNPDMSDREFILLCNESTFGARNETATQKAIKALALNSLFGFTDPEAAKYAAIKDRRTISFARRIQSSKFNEEYNILDTLAKGESIIIDGQKTKSIEVAKKIVVAKEEAELLKLPEELDQPLKIDYNELIHTETGRAEFWEMESFITDQNTKLKLIDTINKKIDLSKVVSALYYIDEKKSKEKFREVGIKKEIYTSIREIEE